MAGKLPTYVHLLLFKCAVCKDPLVIPVMSDEYNLEGIDGGNYDLSCDCGWVENLVGLEAVRHYVAPWGK